MKPRSIPNPLLQKLYVVKLDNNYASPEPPTSSRLKSLLKLTELPIDVPYESPSSKLAIISSAYPLLGTSVFPINYATGFLSDCPIHTPKFSHIMDPSMFLIVQ